MNVRIFLFVFFFYIVSARRLRKGVFYNNKIDKKQYRSNIKKYRRQLKNIVKLRKWKKDNHLSDNLCFIHIPRTGGLSFRKAAKKIKLNLEVWHDNKHDPILKCGCTTNIRDPVKRYISEWKFYGMNYFANKRRIFGWKPASGFTKTFDEYVEDTSTHNAMTKVLSGCQMYSNCEVDEKDIQKIIDRVKNNCLKIMKTENMPVHAHHAIYNDDGDNWIEKATKANQMDIKLYNALKDL